MTTSAYTIRQAESAYKAQSDDPRITTPEIKVYYPDEETKEPSVEITKETIEPTVINSPAPSAIKEDVPLKQEEPHQCELTIQQAVQQHWLAFGIAAFALLTLGFILGKNKVQ